MLTLLKPVLFWWWFQNDTLRRIIKAIDAKFSWYRQTNEIYWDLIEKRTACTIVLFLHCCDLYDILSNGRTAHLFSYNRRTVVSGFIQEWTALIDYEDKSLGNQKEAKMC